MNVKKTKSDVSVNCLYSLGYRFILYYISVDTSVLRRGAALAPVFGFAAAAARWRQQCSFSLSSIIFCNVIFALLSSDLISAALNYDWEILLTL